MQQKTEPHHTAVLGEGDSVQVENKDPERSHSILILEEPLREPVVQHGKVYLPLENPKCDAFFTWNFCNLLFIVSEVLLILKHNLDPHERTQPHILQRYQNYDEIFFFFQVSSVLDISQCCWTDNYSKSLKFLPQEFCNCVWRQMLTIPTVTAISKYAQISTLCWTPEINIILYVNNIVPQF